EQDAAADADAAVDDGDPAVGQGGGERLLQGLQAPGLADRLVELAGQLQLDADDAGQDQHERPEKHRHQVAERGPGRGGGFAFELDLVAHAAYAPPGTGEPASRCSSPMICFCDSVLRSTTSRAWAT